VYTQPGLAKLPVRSMAVECFTKRAFSEASEAWAYGCTLWEILRSVEGELRTHVSAHTSADLFLFFLETPSYGEQPYARQGIQPRDIPASVTKGARLVKPTVRAGVSSGAP
jgi:hypothetical protein